MEPVTLSWSDAEVNDGELTVPLDGEVPKGWKQSFERTLVLLGSGDWGEVALKKGRVVVADVAPGSEEKLKHHLESVVAQANTTLEDPEEESEGAGEGQRSDPDAEMTERFRSD
ncbi:MAG TPA: hypothetical protein VME22_07615 [Solirubrobacteraceae bacterium]|nr:hypothetical protein [Solirubrobacteraceae bacterium]